ncbi:serine/threonine protein kinase, CMGC, CDC2/CDK sub, partial [Coemansia sp. RSA 2337]
EFARFGEDAADLLDQLLQLDPRRRPDAAAALGHRLFFTSPFPARFEDMPKFEHSHEFDRRKQRQQQRQQQQNNLSSGHQPTHQQQPPPHQPPPLPPHHQPTTSQRNQHPPQYSNQHSSPVRRGRDSSRGAWRDDSYVSRPSRNDGHRDSSNRDSFNRDSSSRRNNNYSSGTSRTSASRNAHHPYSRNNGGSSDAGWR